MSLSQKIINSVFWEFIQQLSRRGIGILITLLLAIFLSPADYGLVAMMAVFLAVASSLMNSGFKQALIRLQGASQIDFSTAFYANLCLGTFSYVLLFVISPFIADFYNEIRLTILIRVSGLSILINSFQVVQSAILNREMNFKAQFMTAIPAAIASGLIAVVMAYAGFGVWSLIVQMLLSDLITTVLLWHIQGWRPTFSFSYHSLGAMYNFGYKLFLSGLFATLFDNIYVVVIAKLFTAPVAGCYFFAHKLKEMLVHQLLGTIQTVSYPAFSTLQDDNDHLKLGYRKTMQTSTFILYPIMLFLAALAEPLFSVFFPDKWLPAVPYLQLFCIDSFNHPIHIVNLNIIQVKGRTDLFLYLGIFNKILSGAILSISFKYGVIGILIGHILANTIASAPILFFTAKLINYPISKQIVDFMPSLILSSILALIIYGTVFLLHWPVFAELIILFLVASLLYLTGAHFLKLKAYILIRQIIAEKLK